MSKILQAHRMESVKERTKADLEHSRSQLGTWKQKELLHWIKFSLVYPSAFSGLEFSIVTCGVILYFCKNLCK